MFDRIPRRRLRGFVVTHDLDFGEISALTHGKKASVIETTH